MSVDMTSYLFHLHVSDRFGISGSHISRSNSRRLPSKENNQAVNITPSLDSEICFCIDLVCLRTNSRRTERTFLQDFLKHASELIESLEEMFPSY